jgi:hypothetical protein
MGAIEVIELQSNVSSRLARSRMPDAIFARTKADRVRQQTRHEANATANCSFLMDSASGVAQADRSNGMVESLLEATKRLARFKTSPHGPTHCLKCDHRSCANWRGWKRLRLGCNEVKRSRAAHESDQIQAILPGRNSRDRHHDPSNRRDRHHHRRRGGRAGSIDQGNSPKCIGATEGNQGGMQTIAVVTQHRAGVRTVAELVLGSAQVNWQNSPSACFLATVRAAKPRSACAIAAAVDPSSVQNQNRSGLPA